MRDKYKELFNGVGLFKDYELKFNVDTSVKPVAQPVRRIPFGVREKVEKKLDELLTCGIIEEVPEGPTSWVSPLVVVPKPDGDVRICVDIGTPIKQSLENVSLSPQLKKSSKT